MGKDYYKSLGVSKNASKDEIKKAFRKLAHEYHPDKGTGNEAKFKEINEAYSVLSDDTKRSQYDQFGSNAFNGGGGYGAQGGAGFEGFDFSNFGGFGQGGFGQGENMEFDLGDIFGGIFGGGGNKKKARKGADIAVDTEVTFKESVFGTDKKIFVTKTSLCDHCKGSRAEPGTDFKNCSTCGGAGQVNETRRSIFGNFSSTRSCTDCAGTGKIPKEKCKVCKGQGTTQKKEEFVIVIPPGINDGEMLRLTGAGEALIGGTAGDLYIRVHVKPDSHFKKEGYNVLMPLELKLSDALLGGDRTIATVEGDLIITIPAGITHGEMLRVRGKGVVQDIKHKDRRGDLIITVTIDIPKKLSKKAKQLIEELKNEGI
jgi:molecular chaperone DnaJ